MPADDDAQAEENAESEDEDELEEGLDEMDMDDDARARRPKAKYMKIFVKVANRKLQDVVIDLADLQRVSCRLDSDGLRSHSFHSTIPLRFSFHTS